MKNALIYLVLSALSYPFLAIYNSCAALFRSMGNSRISMQASIVMNIINVAGDILFIFGFHWGVAGAALASLDQPYNGVCHSRYPSSQYGAGDSCQLWTASLEQRYDREDPSYRDSGWY